MSVAVDPELLAKLPIVPVPALPPSRRPKHVIQEAEMTRGVPKIPLQLPARVFINKTKDGKRVKIFGILHYVDNEMGEKDFIFRGRRLNTMYCFQFGTEFFVRPTTVQQKVRICKTAKVSEPFVCLSHVCVFLGLACHLRCRPT